MEKKEIFVRVGTPTLFMGMLGAKSVIIKDPVEISIDQSLDSLIFILQEYRETYKDEYKDLYVYEETIHGYYEVDDRKVTYLYGKRMETDFECELRIKEEEKAKAELEERERKLFENLKKKYE